MPLLNALLGPVKRFYAETFQRRHLRREELRRTWGQELPRERNMALIALYHNFWEEQGESVDGVTWADLGMDDVFAKLDRTVSMLGSQVLSHQLSTVEDDAVVLAERSRQQAVLRADSTLREEAQMLLTRMEGPGGAWLAPLLLNLLPESPWFGWLLFLCSCLSLVCLGGLYLDAHFLLPVLALLAINVLMNETYGRRISPYLPGFCQIERLLGVVVGLAQLPNAHELPQLRRCLECLTQAARIRKRIQWFVVDRTRKSGFWHSFVGYLNLLLLWDILAFLRSADTLREAQADLVTMLEAVGSLDAAISVASYLESLPYSTIPELGESRCLRVVDLYHPLLAAPVGNSIQLSERSALITGSNMAGKTTFIRTIGVNILLARTLHFCLAREALLPKVVVHASIRREDHLAEGQSYYFAELVRLLEFVRAGDDGRLHLFLIDEIFRGTNTVERLAASTAVLHNLCEHQLVLATTHDLELQEMLRDTCDMHHFREGIVNGVCHFDYRIQAGPTRSRNAIRLLELQGYPLSITEEAGVLADQLS